MIGVASYSQLALAEQVALTTRIGLNLCAYYLGAIPLITTEPTTELNSTKLKDSV